MSYKTSLDLFLPASLQGAEIDLKAGNLLTANQSLAARINQHSGDLTSHVGYMQSNRDNRSEPIPIFEDMMKHVGGASVYKNMLRQKVTLG